MENSKKEKLLTESFETLKECVAKGTSPGELYEIYSIIEQMIQIDISVAISMWEWCLDNYPDVGVYCNETFWIVISPFTNLVHTLGINQVLELLSTKSKIEKIIFDDCAQYSNEFFTELINANRLYEFTKYYEMIEANSHIANKKSELGDLLVYLSQLIDGISGDGIDLLLQKAGEISKQTKATVTVNLMKYM